MSDFLLYREVRYNFTTEGFLSPELLQTLGKARIPEEVPLETGRKLCKEEALRQARDRMLRVFLHTRFRLRPALADASSGRNDFDTDYPVRFLPEDLMQARIDFTALLSRAYLALEDFRSRKGCLLVLRLSGEDLPAEIRSVPSNYRAGFTRNPDVPVSDD